MKGINSSAMSVQSQASYSVRTFSWHKSEVLPLESLSSSWNRLPRDEECSTWLLHWGRWWLCCRCNANVKHVTYICEFAYSSQTGVFSPLNRKDEHPSNCFSSRFSSLPFLWICIERQKCYQVAKNWPYIVYSGQQDSLMSWGYIFRDKLVTVRE